MGLRFKNSKISKLDWCLTQLFTEHFLYTRPRAKWLIYLEMMKLQSLTFVSYSLECVTNVLLKRR